MSTRRGCYGVMLAAVLATAACTGGKDEPEPTIPTPSESTALPTATETTDASPSTTAPASLSPEEQDEADATAALEAYLQVLNGIGKREEPIKALNEVAIGTAREQWITQHLYYREQGWTQVGDPVDSVAALDVGGDDAQITVCSDVSEVDVVDEAGESVITDDRLDQTLNAYVLERSEPAEHGWVVVDDTNLERPCDG